MILRTILYLIPLLLFQLLAEAKIYGPKRYDSVGLLTYVSTDLYYTKNNFNSNSKEVGLASGGSYTLLDTPFGARYNLMPNWAVEGELKASYAQSKSSDIVTGGTRTNSQIHEARFSSDYLVEAGGFDIIPEAEVVLPFQSIPSNTDSVMVGEGAMSITGKVHLQTEFGQTDFFSYIGYQKRDQGRSDLMPWSLGLGWAMSSSFLGARLFGFQSLSDDKDKSNTGARDALINKVNGGSDHFYSVNPSVMSAEGLWFVRINRQWKVQASFGFDIAGQSYSKGTFGGLNFIIDWGEKQKVMRHRPKQEVQRARGSGIAVESDTIDFNEDTNETKDQEYFKSPPPPPRVQPPPEQQMEQPQVRMRKASPSDRQLKQQMDDAEMQIELKRKRKK